MGKRSSQEIGAAHERAVRRLLDEWRIFYHRKQKVHTTLGSDIELDFFLPATERRPPVVLECKDFAVEAKNPSDSKRRKTQEALWLLIQVKRYCLETKTSRLVLVTEAIGFRAHEEALLRSELGSDLYIVSLTDTGAFEQVVT